MTTLSATTDVVDLSDGIVTDSESGNRTITTTDAAELPLLTLDPVYGECVQDGTPTPDTPFLIHNVRNPNRLSKTWTAGHHHASGTVTSTVLENGGYKGSRAYLFECTVATSGWHYGHVDLSSSLVTALKEMSPGEVVTVT